MTTRDWKFLVWKSTATSLSTSLVDFTIDNAHLAEVPTITGSRLRPLDGRTEARPWTVNVLDSSSFFTKEIGDSGGRLDLLNRFVQARLSINGSTYQPVAGGRLIDAVNAEPLPVWQLTVQDEWLAGANTMLFTTNTTLLYPPRPYRGYKGAAEGRQAVGRIDRIGSKRWWVRLQPFRDTPCPPLTDEGADFIRGDVDDSIIGGITTKGRFKHLRFRYNGTDYKVIGFKTIQPIPSNPIAPDPHNALFDDDQLYAHQHSGAPLYFWVAASSTAFGGAGGKNFGTSEAVALHAMSAPASPGTPLHIWPGWSASNPYGTVHPMQVLKDVMDGVYSSSSEAVPYYSTESFTGTHDLRRMPSVGVAFRITQTAKLRDWVTENLLVPHGVAAFGDARGKVAFKSIFLPDPQLGYSTASLYAFTSTNLAPPFPDWRTSRREQVTQIEMQYERLSPHVILSDLRSNTQPAPGYEYITGAVTKGGDGLAARFDTTRFNHDRIDRFGIFPLRVQCNGYGTPGDYSPYASSPSYVAALKSYQADFTKKVFDRYGDGPIQGTLTALPTASTVAPGDFVRFTLSAFPSPSSGGYRGGTRLLQILTKDITPSGYQYEYLDAGAAAAIPTSPTMTLSTSTSDPKHALRATVSAGIPSGGAVALYAAESGTTSAPGSSHAAWHPVPTTTPNGLVMTTGTYTLNRLKSNTRYFFKAQAAKPNSPRSNYSTPTSKVTASITSPSGLSMSSVKAHTAGMAWTIGDSDYPVDIHADTSTNGTPTTSNLLFRLLPGSNQTVVAGLTASQKYRSWVRHADPYGGYSGFDSTTFTMTSTATTSNVRKAPALGGLYVVFGST